MLLRRGVHFADNPQCVGPSLETSKWCFTLAFQESQIGIFRGITEPLPGSTAGADSPGART